jgi:hypothetical protein
VFADELSIGNFRKGTNCQVRVPGVQVLRMSLPYQRTPPWDRQPKRKHQQLLLLSKSKQTRISTRDQDAATRLLIAHHSSHPFFQVLHRRYYFARVSHVKTEFTERLFYATRLNILKLSYNTCYVIDLTWHRSKTPRKYVTIH